MKMKKILTIVICSLCYAITLIGQNNGMNLSFNENGRFRIAQFTDIHYVIDSEESEKSLKLMKDILAIEKPDMVVFTGDIITSRPQKRGWDEVLGIVIEQKLPYAVVLGNHDDEHDWTREEIISYISTKPYSLVEKGPAYLKGVGNYVLEVKDRETNTVEALLYCMDSNAYNQIGDQKGYDWFGYDQVEWYRKNSASYTKRNQGHPYPALAFFHIPLQEYTLLSDTTRNYVQIRNVYGERKEKECPGILNTGMFSAMVDCGDVMGTFVGHDHDNNYIGYLNNICLAYGKFSGSKTTYTNIGSGSRIIELKKGQKSFDSWIRTREGQVINKISYPESFLLPRL